MKTFIEVFFSVAGVTSYDDVQLNKNKEIKQKRDEIVTSLEKASTQKPILWTPFPESEYQSALEDLATSLHSIVAKLIAPVLDKLLPFPNRYLVGSAPEIYTHNFLSSGNRYEIRFASADKCSPCGSGIHKCTSHVYCSRPAGSPFERLTWVTNSDSGEETLKYHLDVMYRFILRSE